MQDDPVECARIAAELDQLNRERQAIEQATVAQAEAEAMAVLGVEEQGAVVVTAAEGWHPGVVGLVAARLKERFRRPAFAIALEPGGVGTGSGRSIAGVDLGRAVRQAVSAGMLLKGGGHAMAAGVTLGKDVLGAFRAFLEDAAAAVEAARRDDALLIDGALTAASATSWHGRPHCTRRTVRRRQPRTGDCAARPHADLCRGGGVRAICAPGCARATARPSTPSPSAPPATSSASALAAERAGRRSTPPARCAIDRWNGSERVQIAADRRRRRRGRSRVLGDTISTADVSSR